MDGSAEGRTLCSCHLPCYLTTEKLCLVQLHRSLSLEPEFHIETQGPLLREASSVHTFISFPISEEILTGIRILGGNRSRIKLLGKQAAKYVRSQRFRGVLCSKRWGGACWAGCWRVRMSICELWEAGSIPARESAWREGNRSERGQTLTVRVVSEPSSGVGGLG